MADPIKRHDLNSASLPAKCCGRCIHARKVTDAGTLRTVYVCKAGPPTPIMIAVQTRGGTQYGQQARFPVMMAGDECDSFAPGGPVVDPSQPAQNDESAL